MTDLQAAQQRIAELEAQLEAVGAGGVGPQRITASPEQWESAASCTKSMTKPAWR